MLSLMSYEHISRSVSLTFHLVSVSFGYCRDPVSSSSHSGVRGSARVARAFLQSKCNFIAVLKQFLAMYEEI